MNQKLAGHARAYSGMIRARSNIVTLPVASFAASDGAHKKGLTAARRQPGRALALTARRDDARVVPGRSRQITGHEGGTR